MNVRSRAAALVVAILLAIGLVPNAAHAADDPTVTWGVATADTGQGKGRANFGYALDPGQTVRDAMVVSNHDDEPLELEVYAADGFTTKSGQLDLLPRSEKSKDLGTWVTVRRGRVTVPAGDSIRIPFTVDVPDDATPGDHTGGVVTALPVRTQDQGITVDRRLGIRMHVRVSGELNPQLAVQGLGVTYDGSAVPFASGTATVSYLVTNTGNARMGAEQSVRVTGPFGLFGAGASSTPDLPELLPGESFPIQVKVPGVFPAFRLEAEVTLRTTVAGTGEETTAGDRVVETATTSAVPWTTLLLLVLLAFAAVLWRIRTRKRKAAEDQRVQEAVEAALAEKEQSQR